MSSTSKTHDSPPHPAYRPDIDGLRAVAVGAVLLFHAFPEALPGGFIGVDIFFVISGYLISTIVFGQAERDSFSILEFYRRRVRRIFPGLTVLMIAVLVAGALLLYADELRNLGAHLSAGSFFASNLLLWRESGYFDESAELKPLLHLWSLGIEEQFYLFWPLLAWVGTRRRGALPWLAAAVVISSMAAEIWLMSRNANTAFYLPISRFWELACGGLLAWVDMDPTRRARSWLRRYSAPASTLGALTLLVSLLAIHPGLAFPGWWAWGPVAGAMLLIGSGSSDASPHWPHRLLASRPMVQVGLISYPLYLWHWPLLAFAAIVLGQTAPASYRVTAMVAAVLLAWLTYRFVERPFRSGRLHQLAVPLLSSAMIALGLTGLALVLHGRATAATLRETFVSPSREPVIPRHPDRARVMLLGDSHANHLDAGLRASLGDRLLNLSSPGCLPFYDVDRYDLRMRPGECPRLMREALDLLLSRPDIDTVVMSSMGPVYLDDTTFRGTAPARVRGQRVIDVRDPAQSDRWRIYADGLDRTLTALTEADEHVIFVLDVPELGLNPSTCRPAIHFPGTQWRLRGGEDCTIPRAEFDDRTARFRDMVVEIVGRHPSVRLVDPTSRFCDANVCRGASAGEIWYRDFDHLSESGSHLVAREILPLLADVAR
ncbi:MAG: acyltransferase [Deltaproteobacteria bacterium]|nr:acyltransferase [Deltaproteobacteria bacterium]